MGEMADYAIDQVCTMEGLRDDYVNGNMSMNDAFDHGFIDSTGCEQEGIQDAWDRNGFPTREYLDNEISHSLKDLKLSSSQTGNYEVPRKSNPEGKPEITENHLKTIKFLHGFAKHYMKYSKLSEKQMNIISTNFPKKGKMDSVEHFCHCVDRNGLTDGLGRIIDNHILVEEY